MKRFILAASAALTLVACASSVKEAEPTVFEGRMIGYSGEYVEFFLRADRPGEFREIPLNVAEDGTFCDTVYLDRNEYDAALFADRFMFRICVEQGKHYVTEFDLSEPGVETNFRFIGEGEKENAFLARYWETFTYVSQVVDRFSACTSFKDYSDSLAGMAASLREDMAEIDNKPFCNYYETEIERSAKVYAVYYAVLRINASGVYRPEKEYLEQVASKKLSADEMATFADIVAYGYNGINLRELMRAVADLTPKKEQKAAMETLLRAFVGAGNNAYLEDGLAYCTENFAGVSAELEELCANALSLGPGKPAPDIECVDLDGGTHHLAEFNGKPLYIDLWASWCGPCCEEIPYLAKLVEQLGDDPEIVCISISIDEDRENWIAKLEEENPSWPQFLASEAGEASVSNEYGVSGIPRFILIAPDGTIASVNAPRPSTANVLEALREML